jgi:hypothetical protein
VDDKILLVGGRENALYIAYERKTIHGFAMALNRAEFNCDRPAFPRRENLVKTIRESVAAMALVHPDALELVIARCIQSFLPCLPAVNRGQFYGLEIGSNEKILLLENPAHGAYTVEIVCLRSPFRYANELPVRRLGPLGYRYWFDSTDTIFVNIPPEGCIPICIVDL